MKRVTKALINLCKKHISRILITLENKSAYVPIEGSWENFVKQRSKKFKKNLQYFEKRLIKNGGFEVITYSQSYILSKYLIEAFNIEK